MTNRETGVTCPECGTRNDAGTAFCAGCHKALGDIRYVREEFEAMAARHERLAEQVTRFVARPQFFVTHLVWIGLWVAANTGMVALWPRFDAYPYNLLGIVLAVEALFITGFVLIAQSRQASFADLRAELDYEVNVRTFHELQELREAVRALQAQTERLEGWVCPPSERQQRQ